MNYKELRVELNKGNDYEQVIFKYYAGIGGG